MAGITSNVSNVDDAIPPTIGAAIRRITSEPVPVPYIMGNNPIIMVTTVIIFGRTRSAAPVTMALYKSANDGVSLSVNCAIFSACLAECRTNNPQFASIISTGKTANLNITDASYLLANHHPEP